MKKFLFRCFFSYIFFAFYCFGLSIPELTSEGAILIESSTQTILYAKNKDYTFYPASTTKVLTSLLLLEDLKDDAIVSKTLESIHTVPRDSSHIGLLQNDTYTSLDGLYAILLSSDNFVSHDMAVYDAGSIDGFSQKMNAFAKVVGANSSHFSNPHGYHDSNHYTTPYDLALISNAAFANPRLTEIAGTPLHTFSILNRGIQLQLTHTSLLHKEDSIYYNPYVVASKTGYHTPAGRTLVAKAVYDDLELIGVVMKGTSPLQFEDMNKLFEYGQANFKLEKNEQDEPSLINTSYSPWAKPILAYATQNSWIEVSTKSFKDPLSKRNWLEAIQKALPKEVLTSSFIKEYSSPIYLEMEPITLLEASTILYNLASYMGFSNLQLFSDQFSFIGPSLDASQTQALSFVLSTGILSPQNTLQDRVLTYEEAIALLYRFYQVYQSRIYLSV
jgi:D-alanyl-D-alanine carboxypeptidase